MFSGFRIDFVDTGLFKLINRKQLHCCDAQLFKIRYLFTQAEISSFLIDFGTGVSRIAPNMEFIDNHLLRRSAKLLVVTPIETTIINCTSPVTNCQAFGFFLSFTGIHYTPLRSTRNCLGIGVDQYGIGVKRVELRIWVGLHIHLVSIAYHIGVYPFYQNMPDRACCIFA